MRDKPGAVSYALTQKIAKLRANAPHELPKARLCSQVILAALEGEDAIQSAIVELKQSVGNNWSLITALQFMSGRRGEFAADCGTSDEQVSLLWAHQIAKQICNQQRLGGVDSLDGLDIAKLIALIEATRFALDGCKVCRGN